MSLFKQTHVPGLGLTLGVTLSYLSLLVLIPLAALLWKSSSLGWQEFFDVAFDARARAAYRLTFGTALVAALINLVFGVLVAWVLVRYRFVGRRLIDAVIDLPFALPTAVAGIALAGLYAENGPLGRWFSAVGMQMMFNPTGIVLALTFVGLPFVVRTVQPAIEELDRDQERAAATLGASRLQVVFLILAPVILPSALTGFALALARGVGEYGSVIFVAGNMPYVSEIAPLLIVIRLEQYDYAGAAAVGSVMLVIAFALLLLINVLQHWSRGLQRRVATE